MDIVAHALYGVAFCSRAGLAGGRTGLSGRRWFRDPSVGLAVFFGLLPDILSMWVPFALHFLSGTPGNFFAFYDGHWLVVYRLAHSLIVSVGVALLIFRFRRAVFLPSLAWTVHILCDAVSHGAGKFQTTLFYPASSWGIVGIPFWRYPGFVAAYWGLLAVLWAGLLYWRRTPRFR